VAPANYAPRRFDVAAPYTLGDHEFVLDVDISCSEQALDTQTHKHVVRELDRVAGLVSTVPLPRDR
jgi:hypothetical protein